MGKKIIAAFSLTALVSAAVLSCLRGASLRPEIDSLDRLRDALARETGPLEAAAPPQAGPYVSEYWANADRLDSGYRFPGVRLLGTVETAGYRLGVALLLPPAGIPGRGTIIALHGYAAYSALNLPALSRLAAGGWSVLAVDLPGHGFSSGPSADIGDFSEYGACVRGVIDWIRAQRRFSLPRPLALLGHSTGGSAVLEALWRNPAGVDRAVLVAPLLELKGFGMYFNFTAAMSGLFRTSPVLWPRAGFLCPYELPFSWLEAYGRFRGGLSRRPPLSLPLLVVQGDDDVTLDWRAGLADLDRFAPGAEVRILSGRGHVLFDPGPARAETLAAIADFLRR